MTSFSTLMTHFDKKQEELDSLMIVPQEESIRTQILSALEAKWNASSLFGNDFILTRLQLEAIAKKLLNSLGLSLTFTGWTMVCLANRFWKNEVQNIPFTRRILLLPHCMRNAEKCEGKYDEKGLICRECGNCHLSSLQKRARRLGYQVLIAEGTPIVMQWILSGKADAILGLGCLKSLEKAFDKLIWAGIPALAIPLFNGTCSNTKTDLTAVVEMIETPFIPNNELSNNHSWIPLLRITANLFQKEKLEQLFSDSFLGRSFSQNQRQPNVDSPFTNQKDKSLPNKEVSKVEENSPKVSFQQKDHLAKDAFSGKMTPLEEISQDFLSRGGKFYRPFITIAVFDLMKNGFISRSLSDITNSMDSIPDFVRQTAVAMELFHKASLVHDDIEDDDPFRYGLATLHREIGIAAALNVGDYLLGLGYHLIASLPNTDSVTVADLLTKMSRTHLLLCNGQGLELDWISKNQTQSIKQSLTPLEAIRIYALKTSPAFEASFYAGLRLAVLREQMNRWESVISQFSRYLGIGFQIRNDLNDWTLHSHNKKIIGEDFFRGRPTLLWAFANETLNDKEREKLNQLAKTANSFLQQRDAFRFSSSPGLKKKEENDSGLSNENETERQKILDQVQELYEKANVFAKSNQLIQLYSERSRQIIKSLENEPISVLMQSFIETILR
ncbi:MAG: polyprenyl synthetase family protein [Planctomycetia bacterium]|nr:polyprenyl synthetase family protein [Planctomycetia bacterium]